MKKAVSCLVALVFALFSVAGAHAAEPVRVLVYGDSNVWGWNPDSTPEQFMRYTAAQRWSGKLGSLLGEKYLVMEVGLNGRNTGIEGTGMLNGLEHLPVALAAHSPLDLVVICLGVNDFQAQYGRSAQDVAAGVDKLVKLVLSDVWRSFPAGTGKAPKVLLLAPSAFNDTREGPFAELYADAHEKSLKLPGLLAEVARVNSVEFLNLGRVVPYAHGADGLHYTVQNHAAVAAAVAKKIWVILP